MSKFIVRGTDGNRHTMNSREIEEYEITDNGRVEIHETHMCPLCTEGYTVASGEQRPMDLCQEAGAVAAEAAELAEHIRDTEPRWKREELFDQLIEMIDDAHEAAIKAEMGLDE